MADPTLKELTETFVLTYDHQHALDEIERLQEESERFRTLLVEERRLHQLTHNAHMEKLIEAESMRNAIEAMRVAGGKDEFQAAFDRAKALLTANLYWTAPSATQPGIAALTPKRGAARPLSCNESDSTAVRQPK